MPNEVATQSKEKTEVRHDRLTDLKREDVAEITCELRRLLADPFALYLKTKNFHWHMAGQHFLAARRTR